MIEDDAGHERLIERDTRRAGVNNEIVALGGQDRRLGRFFSVMQVPDGQWRRLP